MQISIWEQFVSISDEEDRLSYPVFLESQIPLLNTKQFNPYSVPYHVRMVANTGLLPSYSAR